MASPDKAYISAENATHAVTWLPPQVGLQASKIPTAEKEAREAKRRALERAKERVEDVEPAKLPTAEQIAAVFDAARKEGFAEGLAAGTAQGVEQGRTEGAEKAYAEHRAQAELLKSTLQHMIENLAGPTEQQQHQISVLLSQVVKRLSRKLVMTELSTPSPHIENLVSACVALLPATQTTRRAVIRLHPDDLAYLRGEAQLASILAACEWRSDPEITQGGCVVVSASSQIDATVESQLQALFEHFDNGSFSSDCADEAENDVVEKHLNAAVDSTPNPLAESGSTVGQKDNVTSVFHPADETSIDSEASDPSKSSPDLGKQLERTDGAIKPTLSESPPQGHDPNVE